VFLIFLYTLYVWFHSSAGVVFSCVGRVWPIPCMYVTLRHCSAIVPSTCEGCLGVEISIFQKIWPSRDSCGPGTVTSCWHFFESIPKLYLPFLYLERLPNGSRSHVVHIYKQGASVPMAYNGTCLEIYFPLRIHDILYFCFHTSGAFHVLGVCNQSHVCMWPSETVVP